MTLFLPEFDALWNSLYQKGQLFLSCVAVIAAVFPGCGWDQSSIAWAKEPVSLQVKDPRWGWEKCGEQNGGDGEAPWLYGHLVIGTEDHCSPLNLPGAGIFFLEVTVLFEPALRSPVVLFGFSPAIYWKSSDGITSSNWFWHINGVYPYREQTTLFLTIKYWSAARTPSCNNLWV